MKMGAAVGLAFFPCKIIPDDHLLDDRFGGLLPPDRKLISSRPQRLCGENSILD
jgi:hypothetical protein